jgi:hypothetical protein
MMQRRGFYLLLSAGVVLIAAAVIGLVLGSRGPAPPPPPQPVFPGLTARLGELAWIRVARGAAKVDFANVAGRWVVIDKDNYPADPDKLRRLLLGLADLTLAEPETPDHDRSAPIDRDGAAGGEPTLIVLRGRTGETVAQAVITLHPNPSPAGGTDMVLVRRPGDEHASPAHGSLDLPVDLLGWLDRSIVDLPPARVASLSLTGADGSTLTMRRNSPEAAFALTALPEGTQAKTDAGLSDLAGALAGLVFDDVKPRALFELPDSGFARAAFTTFDGLVVDLRLFAHGGTDWVAVAASGIGAAEAESSAFSEKRDRWVYAIPEARAKPLRTRLADLTGPAKGL